jgi:hypothetical protein
MSKVALPVHHSKNKPAHFKEVFMAEKTVEISKVNIKIGKKEIELSVEEAKELKEILNETFGEKGVVYIPQPYPVYERPWRWRYWGEPTWTYVSGGTDATTQCYTVTLTASDS